MDNFLKENQYYIIRSREAGVFAAYIESADNDSVILKDSRRIWYWEGAASLSQLSQDGIKKTDKCYFPCEIKRMKVFNVIEIIEATEEAKKSIAAVPIWEDK